MSTKVAEFCRTVESFCQETAQWRRPVASAIYLLATNAVFWACVFYGEHFYQFTFLVCLSVSIFVGHVVVPFVQSGSSLFNQSSKLSEQYETFCQLSLKDKTLMVAKVFFMVPFYLIIFPLFVILRWILMEKFVEYTIMTASAGAAGLLRVGQIEKACWISYITVLFILSVPPWRNNQVTEQLTACVESTFTSVSHKVNDNFLTPFASTLLLVLEFLKYYCLGYWIPPLLAIIKRHLINFGHYLYNTIIYPIYRFICSVKAVFVYVFFGYWIPPLVDFVQQKLLALKSYIIVNIVDPVHRFLIRVKVVLVYWLCGHWIPPMLEFIHGKWNRLKMYIQVKIVDPFVAKLIAVKNFLVYWFGGYWIPPFKQWCFDCKQRAVAWWHRRIVDPVVDFFLNFTENMTYILLGRWIPGFLEYLYNSCIIPFVDFCIRCKNATVYVVCGYWIPDLLSFMKTKKDALVLYAKENYVNPFIVFVYDTVNRMKVYLLETKARIRRYIVEKFVEFRSWLTSAKIRLQNYLIETRKRLKRYIIYDVWIPFKKTCRRSWIRLKFFVKYRIVYPIIRNSILAIIYFCEWTVVNVAKPLLEFLYEQSVHVCGYMWYYYGDPCWHWVAERLPEKSPFVDDSDTELKDYLPSAEQDDDAEESESEEDEVPEHRRSSGNNLSRTPSSSSLEEAEFSQNLEIPAFEHADSDEEQEREMMPVSRPTKLFRSSFRRSQRTAEGDETVLRSSLKRSQKTVGGDETASKTNQSPPSSSVEAKTSPSSPLQDLSNALTSAASFAVLKATASASFLSSQMSNILLANEIRNEESTFEAELEPDFELVQHSDVED